MSDRNWRGLLKRKGRFDYPLIVSVHIEHDRMYRSVMLGVAENDGELDAIVAKARYRFHPLKRTLATLTIVKESIHGKTYKEVSL